MLTRLEYILTNGPIDGKCNILTLDCADYKTGVNPNNASAWLTASPEWHFESVRMPLRP